ncbi:MAG: hypothetical protein BWY31_00748 [Lentisphaerae bacterium ADurb.Bin242]|nr:MAG: hypothetical protein BWY31_00748 [Lentisphaerae bacterium ADurb.Bin242]
MELFIGTVLIFAGIMSFAKLALLPRGWSIAAALLLIPFALLFQERLAQSSLANLTRVLTGADALREWCVLVVVQELLVCIAGANLLSSTEEGRAPPKWSFFALLPSMLLPAGVLYLKLLLFNCLLDWDFTVISIVLAVILPLAGWGIAEGTRMLFPDREALTEKLLQGELLFILLGTFLPAVAAPEFQPVGDASFDWLNGGLVLLALAAPAGTVALFYTLYRKYKYRRFFHDAHHTNS